MNLCALAAAFGIAVMDASTLPREPFVEKVEGSLASFRMLPVPDGSIEMGGRDHQIRGLWMSETEVTWDVFDVWAFRLDMTPDEVARGADAESRPSRPYGAPDQGFGHSGYAAITMTFHAAQEFCKWLSQKTGRKYRLPTEAEWEYSCRAAQGAPKDLEPYAWFWDNADDSAQAVGRKQPNAWGFRDMLGNVWEWTVGLDGEPVTCGGSYASRAEDVHAGARLRQQPKWNDRDPQNPKSKWWLPDAPFVGFRVVCE